MPRNSKTAAVAALALALRAHAQTLPAATAPDTKSTSNIAQLEHDLASEDFQTRERAQQVLTRLSPANKEDLRQLAKRATDPEVQARLLEAVALLEEIEATDPPHISADLDQVALARIAATLTKSLGTPIASAGADDAYTLKVKDVSFPEIMQILNQQHPLWVDYSGSTPTPNFKRLTGVWAKSMTWRGFGVFIRDGALPLPPGAPKLNLARGGAAANTRSFVLGVITDPRIRLAQSPRMVISSVTDDTSNSWPTLSFGSSSFSTLAPRRCAFAQNIQLFMPNNSARQIASVRGEVTADVALAEDTVVLPNIAEKLNQPIDVGNCEITIKNCSVTDQKGMKMLNLQVAYKPIQSATPSTSQQIAAIMSVQDADGKDVLSLGLQGGTGSMGFGMQMTGKEPSKITIIAPTRVKTITIPFEFKNLPIPADIAATK